MASGKKYLVLAEGRSGDEHYGKTMRGIVHYAPDPVVAILDSERAGESYREIPIVATVEEALAYGPTTATVGVATQGGRFPPAWRELLKDSIRAGLDLESGLHEFISDDPELSGLAREHGVELRDLRKPPPELSVPTGENLQVPAKIVLTVGSDCAIGKKTVAVELDLAARKPRPEVRLRPDRPDRDRDRGLGDRDRRRRRGLPRRRSGAARGRGLRSEAASSSGSKGRDRWPTRRIPGSRWASSTAVRRMRTSSSTRRGPRTSRGIPTTHCPTSAS